MQKKTLAVVIAGAVALAGTVAVAGVQGAKAERARQYMTWKMSDALDEIDATEAQRATAAKLADGLFDEGLKVRETKNKVRDGLVEQWKRDKADPSTVHALVDQLLGEVRTFAHKAADAAITFHDILTPEQRKEALERYESRRSRWRE